MNKKKKHYATLIIKLELHTTLPTLERKNYTPEDLSCSTCLKPIWLDFFGAAEYVSKKRCFTCHHFLSLIENYPPLQRLVVETKEGTRNHYLVGEESAGFKGFGGQRFQIFRPDNTEIISTNLWFQGEIPKYLWDHFPTSASLYKKFPPPSP